MIVVSPHKGSRSTARDRARLAAALSPRVAAGPGTPLAEGALETWRPIGLLREPAPFKAGDAGDGLSDQNILWRENETAGRLAFVLDARAAILASRTTGEMPEWWRREYG